MGGLPFRVLKGLGALLLFVLAGCGGRSSTLEQDPDGVAIEPNQPTGGSSGETGAGAKANVGPSGPAAGGKGGTSGATGSGTAGSAPAGNASPGGAPSGGIPSGGAASAGAASAGAASAGAASAGAAGIDPYALSSCIEYCRITTEGPCPPEFGAFDQCNSSCVNEVTGQSPECQKAAGALLTCLWRARRNSSSCADVDQISLARCSGLADAYSQCSGSGSVPTPTPTPRPRPLPTQTCSSSGSSSNGACNLDVKCSDGVYYAVSCYQSSPDQSTCSCSATSPDGSGSGASIGLNENVTFACYDTLAACGFPQIGAK